MNKQLLKILTSPDTTGQSVLCRIVHSSGSTPRRAYPFMIVWSDGRITGTIGGGGLEYQVINTCGEVLDTGKPQTVAIDMNGTDIHASGSLCGGSAIALLEKFDRKLQEIYQEILKGTEQGHHAVLFTEIHQGKSLDIRHSVYPTDPGSPVNTPIKIICESIEKQRSVSRLNSNNLQTGRFIPPPEKLHIFGGGHVGKALSEFAVPLNMEIFVYDDRNNIVNTEIFPEEVKIVNLPVSELIGDINFSNRDAILVSTRNHQLDLDIMSWLVTCNFGYLGLISSRRKWLMLKKELIRTGTDEDILDRVCSPAGLHIASDTVPEIAISVLAEIIYVLKTGNKNYRSMSTTNRLTSV